jgi:hypothetical protein
MSRRPSLPGAAELFRATGGSSAAPAERAPGREPGREPAQRLRAAEEPAESTPTEQVVSPVAAAAAAERLERIGTMTSLGTSPVPEPEPVAMVPPAGSKRRAVDGGPIVRVGNEIITPLEDEPAPRPTAARTNGVRQTRRPRMRTVAERRPTGRERHEEKITVYCSAEELIDLETARLSLRGEHGLVVDRGRIVREAVAIILADLDAKGEDSILVRRFREG